MARFLRFQLYGDPGRSHYSPLHADIEVADAPALGYGQPVRVGDEGDDPTRWPEYVVAHLVHLKQEADPLMPGRNHIIYEVYLARSEQWPLFDIPEAFKQVREEDELL